MADSDSLIRNLAERLRAVYETGTPCPPLRDRFAANDLDAAYAVQEANTRHWLRQGRRPVGRKIGITSHAVQVQLGVD
ncbi:MAG: 2-keto-4-pentenoate hydratase, partial [Gammaproteobacteria bacterium]|nr:2-keto-4-pentenoate hydratase [Gammaproteobacteria bacterium]